MSKTVLITGANGFVGSHLVDVALERGFEVTACIRQESSLRFIKGYGIDIVRVDYLNTVSLSEQLKGSSKKYDLVIHCAGVTEAKDSNEFTLGNVEPTKNLIECLDENHLLKKNGKLIYYSSLAARGPRIYGVDKDTPITAYGRSKLEAEELVKNSRIPYLIIRPTAVYGPRDKAFFELVKTISNGFEVSLSVTGQKLTMIYGRDLAMLTFDSASLQSKTVYGYDGVTYGQADISNAIKEALAKRNALKISIPVWFFKVITAAFHALYNTFLRRNWKYTPEKVMELTADDWSISEPVVYNQKMVTLTEGFDASIKWYRENGWI